MFQKNTAHSYAIRRIFTWGHSGSADFQYFGHDQCQITWGLEYSAGVTGWELTFHSQTANPFVLGDHPSYYLRLVTPFGTYTLGSSSVSNISTAQVDIQFTNANVSVNSACDFTFTYDSAVIKLNGTTAFTFGSYSQSGSGTYDERFNLIRDFGHAYSNALPIIPSQPNCATSYAAQVPEAFDTSLTITGGQKIGSSWDTGVPFDIHIDVSQTLPSQDSTCVPSIAAVSDTDSGNVTYFSELHLNEAVTDDGVQNCNCAPPATTIVPATGHVWHIDREIRYITFDVGIKRKDSGIVYHERTQYSDYMGDEKTVGPTTIAQTYTDCSLYISAGLQRWRRYCYQIISPGICSSSGMDGGVSSFACSVPNDTICWETGYIQLRWPTKPPCPVNAPRSPNWIVEDPDGRYYQSFVDSTGAVHFRRSLFNLPWLGWDSDLTIFATTDAVAARFAFQADIRRLWMVVERQEASRNLYWTYSDDFGSTWTDPVLIMANAFYGSDWTMDDHSVGRCWFEYNSGTSGPGVAKGQMHDGSDMTGGSYHFGTPYVFVDDSGASITVADGGMSNVQEAAGQAGLLVWSPTLDGDTTPSTFYSTNRGLTWKKF